MTLPAALLAAAGLLPAADPAPPPGCECYLALFAMHPEPYQPTKTHTFAAVARVVSDPASGARIAHVVSISWLPATLQIRPHAVRPEPGVNLPLRESIAFAKGAGATVSLWGPYPVRPELFDLFQARVAWLGAGARYKVPDFLYPASALHCVHGVTGVATERRRAVGGFGFGERATAETLHLFAPWILTATAAGADVLALFGVAECEVTRREYCYPGPTRLQSFKSFLQR